jgi:LacI family transcriptional regulator
MPKINRTILADIAAEAGVSLATVDRVMNERGSVSDAMRRRVLKVARELGTHRVLPSPIHGVLRFDFVFGRHPTDHFSRVEQAMVRYAQLIGPRIAVHRHTWDEEDEVGLVQLLAQPSHPRHGVIVVAHDTPGVRAALQSLIARGTPVVLVTTDVAELVGHTYVGIDHVAAGRTAAHLLGQWVHRAKGDVLLVTNSLRVRAHGQRIDGFTAALAERSPGLRIVGPGECFDRPDRVEAWVSEAIAGSRKVVGIYNTGAGSSGIRHALKAAGIAPPWIAHEATDEHAAYMREGSMTMVIDQDAEAQALASLQHLLHANDDHETPAPTQPRFQLMTLENLPPSLAH